MPLQQADFPDIAGVDDWPRWNRLWSAAAGLPGTSSLGAGSGAAGAGLTHDSARQSFIQLSYPLA